MDNNQALEIILNRLSVSDRSVLFGFDELQEWQKGVLALFVKAKLLVKDVQTQSLECVGCEQHCFMPVVWSEVGERAFIVCDDPDKQDYMGRITFPLKRLQQWQASTKQVATLIAELLAIKDKPTYQNESGRFKLGMLKGSKGRRWVTLTAQPLAIEINQHPILVNELLYFEDNKLVIDRLRIDDLVNSSSKDASKSYSSNTNKREERTLKTQTMYKDWNDEYLKITKQFPQKTDTWYSVQISKLPIAKNRDSETIRKKMK